MGILNARFIEDSLSFLRIKGERISLQRPRQAGRQEALVNKVLAFQQIFGDAFIIDQPARASQKAGLLSSGWRCWRY